MQKKYRILIAAVAALVVLAVAGGTAVLAQPGRGVANSAPTQADYAAWGCPFAGGDLTAVATLLGMTQDEINAQLQTGKSLVEIAATKNVTEDQLVAAIIEPMKQFMQQQVTAGVWTQAQLDARLKLAEQHIRQLVNDKGWTSGTGGFGSGNGNGCGMMGGYGTNGGTTTTPGVTGRRGMMGGFGTTSGTTFGRGGMMGGWGRTTY